MCPPRTKIPQSQKKSKWSDLPVFFPKMWVVNIFSAPQMFDIYIYKYIYIYIIYICKWYIYIYVHRLYIIYIYIHGLYIYIYLHYIIYIYTYNSTLYIYIIYVILSHLGYSQWLEVNTTIPTSTPSICTALVPPGSGACEASPAPGVAGSSAIGRPGDGPVVRAKWKDHRAAKLGLEKCG